MDTSVCMQFGFISWTHLRIDTKLMDCHTHHMDYSNKFKISK